MAELWNDLRALEQLRLRLDVLAAVLAIVAAALILANRWPIAKRIATLQSHEKASLQLRVSTAEDVTHRLRDELALARSEQKQASHALDTLQERVRPRALTQEQLEQLREGLKAGPAKVAAEILTREPRGPLTEVSELLATQLATAFRARGWRVTTGTTFELSTHGLIVNMTVDAPPGPALPPQNQAIVDTFARLKIPASYTYQHDAAAKETRLQLIIGISPF